MREAGRYVALAEVVGAQHHGDPPRKRRRPKAHVHGDVVDLAFDHAHQLSLRPAQLKVQPAERAAGGARVVVLNEWTGYAVRAVLLGLVGLDEKAPRVAVHVG